MPLETDPRLTDGLKRRVPAFAKTYGGVISPTMLQVSPFRFTNTNGESPPRC